MTITAHVDSVLALQTQAADTLNRVIKERNAASGAKKTRLRRLALILEDVMGACNDAVEEMRR
uniref:Uncharacterized protein n=1 Tax=Caulobacter phage BL57 TaxID=3348355 RepID=A0AB74ULB6_9VIRU